MRKLLLAVLSVIGAGCERQPPLAPLEQVQARATYVLAEPAACHIQGIAILGDRLFASCVDQAASRARVLAYGLPASGFPLEGGTLSKAAEVDLTTGDRFHPSGLAVSASCVWVAVAAYRSTNATASVICLDPATLAVGSSFEVQDHIGAMAVSGDALVGMNWDARQLYAWKTDGTLISKADSPSDGHYQDCDSGSAGPLRCVAPEGSTAEVDALAFDGASGWSAEAVRRVELPGASLGQEGFKIYGSFWLYAPDDFPDAKIHVVDGYR